VGDARSSGDPRRNPAAREAAEDPAQNHHEERADRRPGQQCANHLAIRHALGRLRQLGVEQAARIGSIRIETGVLQVVQPDMFYFGGMTRARRVARMAEAAGLECTPHMSGSGLGFLYAAHFASFAPSHGPHQEYKGTDELPVSSPTSRLRAEKGVVRVPSGPGLDVVFESGFLGAVRVVQG
jgi:hypothetical protein